MELTNAELRMNALSKPQNLTSSWSVFGELTGEACRIPVLPAFDQLPVLETHDRCTGYV